MQPYSHSLASHVSQDPFLDHKQIVNTTNCSPSLVTIRQAAFSAGVPRDTVILRKVARDFARDCEASYETTVVGTQQPALQWTGWLAITWEPQQTRMQQQKSMFCVGPCRRVIIGTKFRD
jgi:hypothetical protein